MALRGAEYDELLESAHKEGIRNAPERMLRLFNLF